MTWMLRYWGVDSYKYAHLAHATERDGGPYVIWAKDRSELAELHARMLMERGLVAPLEELPDDEARSRTVADVVLRYQGQEYALKDEFGYGYSIEAAEYMWTEGNCSCDCNKSAFIKRHCDPAFPQLECGDEVALIRLEIRRERRCPPDPDESHEGAEHE